MRYSILLAPQALEDLKAFRREERSAIRDAIELHLRHEPGKVSKSRIKRLRGLRRPQYRLRVGEVRVFYDIVGDDVQVLAVVEKTDAARWLAELGDPE